MIERIEAFLKTGRREPAQKPRVETEARHGPLSLDTEVTAQFKCDAATRAFFQFVIGEHFHFTAHLQHFRRTHSVHLWRPSARMGGRI